MNIDTALLHPELSDSVMGGLYHCDDESKTYIFTYPGVGLLLLGCKAAGKAAGKAFKRGPHLWDEQVVQWDDKGGKLTKFLDKGT